ncbi:hypothetical protein, partial [Sphingopyxis sp. BSNA05]|uniref:hypothetical protein n=1 Tax=Sphingopyxis sp. BSNA05 TaxID=1236614 RepID=UPI001C2668B4
ARLADALVKLQICSYLAPFGKGTRYPPGKSWHPKRRDQSSRPKEYDFEVAGKRQSAHSVRFEIAAAQIVQMREQPEQIPAR